MEEQPDTHDFAADIRSHVNEFLIPKYEKNMPFRLVDTYTGLILERFEIVSLLKLRRDFRAKVEDVVSEAQQLAVPIDPHCPSERPKLDHLNTFIAEFLAYAMFSHRWRDREPTLQDVKKASHGVYSMDDKDLIDNNPKVLHIPKNVVQDLPTGVEKLQEFCCLAAKCGFRWAWTDTCCINKTDYAETSESINSMFLWYRSSELTIVYLDDVDDIEGGRLSAMYEEDGDQWFQHPEIMAPLPSSGSLGSSSFSDAYAEAFYTDPYLPLHERLRNTALPQLRSMHPDTQVERPHLQAHLSGHFPSVEECKNKGKYRKLPVWVGRGWTLQEMVASKRLRFYSRRWTLLEEAEDYDTDEAEGGISISSFKYRARLVDHRRHDLWYKALINTTGVFMDDLVDFKPGTMDVRSRLLWSARRATTKVEDMAYCLLGIFDVSLPAIYGEGPRAFFRLQEELMKRTGDVSLFDWCGRSSSVNSFLAYDPRCFMIPSVPEPELPDSTDSPFKMIIKLFCAILGTTWSGIKAAVIGLKDWVLNIMKSPPPGHTLINGELNISLFEHQVERWKRLNSTSSGDLYHHYELESDGLGPTTISFAPHISHLVGQPEQYYMCRVWDRHTKNVFQVLLELIEYILQDAWKEIWQGDDDKSDCDCPDPSGFVVVENEDAKDPESKLREEMQTKRRQVLRFFTCPFPVYLVRVQDERRVRVSTVNRVMVEYAGKRDFARPLVARLIL